MYLFNSIIIITLFTITFADNNQLPYSYKGGWPVNLTSNEILDPGYDLPCPGEIGCECRESNDCHNSNCVSHPKGNFCMPKEGEIFPRFEALDQFGESVDLYDFAHQNKMILIELSAAWCSPCKDIASWITMDDPQVKENRWWKDRYLPIKEMISNEEVQLINIMYEGFEKKITVTHDDVVQWYKTYPDTSVPVLADEYKFVHSWVKPTGLPCIILLDQNMRIIKFTNRGLNDAFLYLTR